MGELSKVLCDYFNGFEGRLCDFLPETLVTPCPTAGIFRKEELLTTAYVDGSASVTVPFEIRMRINGISPQTKLDLLRCFADLVSYVKNTPIQSVGIYGIAVVGGCEKTDSFSGGEEEYRMKFTVKIRG